MTQLSLTPIAVFINITTAESWYCQDWETSRRKVNTTHFLASTLFTLFANKLWVCENGERVWMRRTLIPWLTWQSYNADCFRPRRRRRVEAWHHHPERGESAAAGAVQQPRLDQVSHLLSSKFLVLSSTSSNKQHYYPTFLPFPLTLSWGVTRLHSPWSQYNTKCW